ncbi:TRAP transporter small permease [Desulfovibrio sp. OttesenSCG-928-C14]|nr:TRAP transporter small permease [Desulfovibrio sp. OttesenSCG-928-C14]
MSAKPSQSGAPGIWRRLQQIDIAVALVCVVLLVIIAAVQVFCRYVIQSSLSFTEELARYLLVWCVLFGSSFATGEDAHLEISVLKNYVSPKLKRGLMVFSQIATIVFSAYMIMASAQAIQGILWSGQLTPAMQIPAWLIWMALPLGFGLMILRSIIKICQHLGRGR